MKLLAIILFFQSILFCCFGQDCNQIPSHFNSYSSAVSFIKSAHFKFIDKINTAKSSWIRSASYYSCDGKVGYFIFATDNQEYIHKDLPIEIWREFKGADSFGKFYNQNIKHRFQFYLH
jgi:hypothetical protein